MLTTTNIELDRRDLALLLAVAAGRCELSGSCGPALIVDGRWYCDQLAARRLTEAGLIEPAAGRRLPARLTGAGLDLLNAVRGRNLRGRP